MLLIGSPLVGLSLKTPWCEMEIHAQKWFSPPEGRYAVPLSQVSSVTFIYSSENPVRLSVSDGDGLITPLGVLPPAVLVKYHLELREFTGLLFQVESDEDEAVLHLHLDVRHRVGEPVSSVPMAGTVRSPMELTQRERTRRTVLQTLQTLGVMPNEDQLESLEADLGFTFEDDEFGDYLESLDDPLVEDEPAETDAPAEPPEGDEPVQ